MTQSSNRGGRRIGAGRKKGTGIYKEATVVKRIPQSAVPIIDYFLSQLKYLIPTTSLPEHALLLNKCLSTKLTPIATDPVRAGYLNSAEANIDEYIDFNEYLTGNHTNIIGIYAEGNSMYDAGIDEGDLLIVNRNMSPKDKDIVVMQVNQGFTVKRLHFSANEISLHAENSLENYPIIKPNENDQIEFVGLVTHIIKKLT